MPDIQAKLDYADAVADWFLELGEEHALRGELDEGLTCTSIAANMLCKQNRTLISPRVEANLRFVADRLPVGKRLYLRPDYEPGRADVCLHVLTEALPLGGITSLAIRWMQRDRSGRIHQVALLDQRTPVPEVFSRAVARSNGRIHVADPDDSLLQKAVWLRNLARELATVVILHVDVSDVVCGAAFGAPGGPPVLAVNYNAHIFWTGASLADLVVNIRGSALEEYWTSRYRGIARYATVPIPLSEEHPAAMVHFPETGWKREAKQKLGILHDAVVILTVGASFKYLPSNGLDFLDVCEGIVRQVPKAVVLAAGFDGDARWKSAEQRSGSRIRTLGTVSQAQLAVIHDAADVYIEGFPFGTTTSLLEAGLKGIPVVLAPAQCPPPYGSDGVALDDTLDRPVTIEDYTTRIIHLCTDPLERFWQGSAIRRSIALRHTGPGWQLSLEQALRAASHEHAPQTSVAPVRTPEPLHEYWSTFVEQWSSRYEESLEIAIGLALSSGMRPRLTASMRRACRDYRSLRQHRTIPSPLLVFLCSVLFPVLPVSWDGSIFRMFSFLYRTALLSRIRKRVSRLMGRTADRRSWYDEYRQIQDSEKVRET
jgi:hypothetical protein